MPANVHIGLFWFLDSNFVFTVKSLLILSDVRLNRPFGEWYQQIISNFICTFPMPPSGSLLALMLKSQICISIGVLHWYNKQCNTFTRLHGWKTIRNIMIFSISEGMRFSHAQSWRHQWKHFPRYWPYAQGIHRSPVNFPHKGQWHGALMFSLICARINSWVNNRSAGDLRRHWAHYDVIMMACCRPHPHDPSRSQMSCF